MPSVVDVLVSAHSRGRCRVLIVTSELLQASVAKILDAASSQMETAPSYDLIVPKATFFGGDIILGDLLVFSDIETAITEHEAQHGFYDEIVLPATMAEAGADLTGVRFDTLNAAVGHRCRLAHHPRILD